MCSTSVRIVICMFIIICNLLKLTKLDFEKILSNIFFLKTYINSQHIISPHKTFKKKYHILAQISILSPINQLHLKNILKRTLTVSCCLLQPTKNTIFCLQFSKSKNQKIEIQFNAIFTQSLSNSLFLCCCFLIF